MSMSLRAMLWALHDAPCLDPLSKLVLLVLADNAWDDGSHAYPSVKTIADTVPCSRSTVMRHLRVLETQGLIVRGDQSEASGLPPDRRPVVYRLPLQRGITVTPRPTFRGVTDPQNGVSDGVSPVTPEPVNQVLTHGQRAAAKDGKPVGCAAHGFRRPACDPCSRTTIGLHVVQSSTAQSRAEFVQAARAGIQ